LVAAVAVELVAEVLALVVVIQILDHIYLQAAVGEDAGTVPVNPEVRVAALLRRGIQSAVEILLQWLRHRDILEEMLVVVSVHTVPAVAAVGLGDEDTTVILLEAVTAAQELVMLDLAEFLVAVEVAA